LLVTVAMAMVLLWALGMVVTHPVDWGLTDLLVMVTLPVDWGPTDLVVMVTLLVGLTVILAAVILVITRFRIPTWLERGAQFREVLRRTLVMLR